MKMFFNRLFRRLKRYFGFDYYKVSEVMSEEPTMVKDKVVYLIGQNEYIWYLMMKCPCGCGEIIKLNTQPNTYPSWQLNQSKLCSITPSVWRVVGCRSHFWLTNGEIKWV